MDLLWNIMKEVIETLMALRIEEETKMTSLNFQQIRQSNWKFNFGSKKFFTKLTLSPPLKEFVDLQENLSYLIKDETILWDKCIYYFWSLFHRSTLNRKLNIMVLRYGWNFLGKILILLEVGNKKVARGYNIY